MTKRPDGRVNIPRDIEDIYYRYHMPVLRARIEGRGNGVKTVIENMSEVAAALERPPTYTTKFFGFELGAQCLCDEKRDKWVVNGRHDQDALAKLLDVFIDKFLLCGTCRNPETTMEVVKNGNIEMRCMACGERTAIDMRHRLASYIQKNPPSSTRYEKAAKQAEDRQTKKTASAASSAPATKEEGGDDGGMGDVDIDASGAKATKDDDEFGENWSDADFSKTAIDKRRMELLGASAGSALAASNDSAGGASGADAVADPIDTLTTYFTQKPLPKEKEMLLHVKTVAMANGWKDSNILTAVFGALFGKDIIDNLKSRTPILALFVQNTSDQKHVLYLIERLCSRDAVAATKISVILNAFYEAELLEEEILIKWFKHPAKKIDAELGRVLRERSKKFVEWLQTADDEEDEEDDEDEE